MSQPAHRINSVSTSASRAPSTYLLRVEWANGGESSIDLGATIDRVPSYAPLKAPELFSQAIAGEWGWDVTWPGGIDMAADRLLSLALEQRVHADNATQGAQPHIEQVPSALDLAGDLVGCLSGSPPDLASNPAYLDRFGETI
jgi:Protein of unknown function (DUF2442)